jgi:anti-anti-sigma factor
LIVAPDCGTIQAKGPIQYRNIPLELTSETAKDGILILTLTGRMDVQGVADIDLEFASAIAGQSGPVVVDMSGIGYIASVGIKAFLVQAKLLKAQGRQIVLAQPNEAVKAVLATIGIERILPIIDSMDAAIKTAAG